MAGLGRGSNPCMVLNSYHQGVSYELLEECGPPHAKEFTMGVSVLGREYRGKGKSKKLAKQAAAASAISDLYNIRLHLSGDSVMIPYPHQPQVPGILINAHWYYVRKNHIGLDTTRNFLLMCTQRSD